MGAVQTMAAIQRRLSRTRQAQSSIWIRQLAKTLFPWLEYAQPETSERSQNQTTLETLHPYMTQLVSH